MSLRLKDLPYVSFKSAKLKWFLHSEKMYRIHVSVMEAIGKCHNSPRARNRLNQVVEAKRFEGVFLCRKVCLIQILNS